ncbi:PemB family protein [Mangrovibacterium diazotrophicum]|uniref:Pectin methylesterase-like acyl-CoA thioesterase n=1 Tax=Mangrovibacterium diazotrophicum TaxID=1261403 RepID=A0A419W676_9BACT|nr:hypothetical protein [Mangrovibacterium diazotrophicum]RKD90971.1 pectin methylesterase-like acyl-CoA thioesterase [Mangrovibacterium diazotrophicum]
MKQRIENLLKTMLFCWAVAGFAASLQAQTVNALNPEIDFGGNSLNYKGEKVALGPKAFYLDGSLTDEQAARYPYVFNTLQDAVDNLTDGTETEPMTIYIAPWVYWVDDPDDPAVRVPKEGSSTPFGMEFSCEWLKFYGLSNAPDNVVLAANRGQTMGSKGNFTLFNIKGNGLTAENITFGNYCNIDLDYPLNPKLNRPKRGSAIVQAQLIFSDGDKVLARNCNFISRLNTGPFWGSKRTLFDGCHFESTDDALNGSAVYLNCTLDFYSSKPFGHTVGTGAVFLNSDMHVLTRGSQYLVKGTGPVALVDSRFDGELVDYLGWRDLPATEARYYQYQVKLNGDSVFMDKNNSFATVDMTGKEVLKAYRLNLDGESFYNTYNLLRGNDGWDPMGIKDLVEKAAAKDGKNYSMLPTMLQVKPTRQKLETGKDSLLLIATAYRFGDFELDGQAISWSLAPEFKGLVKLEVQKDGTCLVIPTNEKDETVEVIVNASTDAGLESAAVISVAPSFLPAPAFIQKPTISNDGNGTLTVNYKLDMPYEDQSLISWYRCSDAKGSNPIPIAVSRFNKPMKSFQLSAGDIGWYLMASVSPKHLRCHPGGPETTVYAKAITAKDVKQDSKIVIPNLGNMATAYQPQVLPGFWALDSYAPADTHEWYWEADNSRDPWYYGPGINGAAQDSGLVQNTKGARLRYEPVGDSFGDMKISFTAVPSKTAGQGFSSARAQYMDIGIKMDVKTMTGYALRLVRTTKYGDAIDFVFMKYENGVATPISEGVSASCYRPNCQITVATKGNKLIAHAENLFDYFSEHEESEVKRVVDIDTTIQPNSFGGLSFQHTGTVGSGATLIKDLKIEWEE